MFRPLLTAARTRLPATTSHLPATPFARSIMVPPSALSETEATADQASSSYSSRARSPVKIPGPVETSMQQKLIDAFQPTLIRISNDSSKHRHHAPMRAMGGGSGETHFAVAMVSSAFKGKTPIARHRMVNALLKDEFEQHGLHALSLRLKTPEEWEKEIDDASR